MTKQDKRDDLNDAVEDALGFNFRSLKTMSDLIVRPRRVFESYAARDRVTYSPAIRLFFGLVGLQVLISALWGGWEGLLNRQIAASDANVRAQFEQASGGDLPTFISHYANAMSFGQPILVALFTSLSVFVLGWFRPQLSWPARLNIAMGVLAVGTLVGVLSMPLVAFEQFQLWVWIGSGAVAFAYFVTTFRGARGVIANTFGGALSKSLIYTAVLMFLVFFAGAVLAVVCTIYAISRMQGA